MFKDELHKIIYDVNMSASSRIEAIINLVDKEVIGQDNKTFPFTTIDMYENQLKAKQRAIIRGNDE